MFNCLLKRVVSNFFYVLYRIHLLPSKENCFRILLYHSINGLAAKDTVNFCVAPKEFEKQMQFISESGFKVVSLTEAVNKIERKETFSGKELVITFDDGYTDVKKYAAPILNKYNFPFTLFVISDKAKKNTNLTYLDEWAYLKDPDLKEMVGYNVSIGSHSKSHLKLTLLPTNGIAEQAYISKRELEKIINQTVVFFSYPYGFFNDKVKNILRKSGYKVACSSIIGSNTINTDLFELRRTEVCGYDNLFELRKKLLGCYDWLERFHRRLYVK